MEQFFKSNAELQKMEYINQKKYLNKIKLLCIYKRIKIVKEFYFH